MLKAAYFQIKPLIYMRCFWLGVETKCFEIVTDIITDIGMCYTFNILDRKDMFKDEMYVNTTFEVEQATDNCFFAVEFIQNFRTWKLLKM